VLNGRISRTFANQMKAYRDLFLILDDKCASIKKKLYKEFENETVRHINVVISPILNSNVVFSQVKQIHMQQREEFLRTLRNFAHI